MIRRLLWFRREFCRLFVEQWPKGAILWTVTQLVVLAVGIALQVAAQLLRGPVKREGPRLDDLSATGVQPGAIIPRPHGHTVTTGQVIAQTRIKETKKKEKSGGKGGPTVETTTYSYSIPAVAVGFSSRRMGGILRIKANEKVIYEQTTDSGLVHRNFDEIEIFLGTETQAPSAILEAHEGVGKVPAYRGTAYFVLKELQLADFGNRMPAFKVECAEDFGLEDFSYTAGEDNAPATADSRHYFVDWTLRKLYLTEEHEFDANASTYILVYDIDTLSYEKTIDLAAITALGSMFVSGIDPETGYLVGWETGATTGIQHMVLDPVNDVMVTDFEDLSGDWFVPSTSPATILSDATKSASVTMWNDSSDGYVHSFPGLIFVKTLTNDASGSTRQFTRFTLGEDGEAWGVIIDEAGTVKVIRYTLGSEGTLSEAVHNTLVDTEIGNAEALVARQLNIALHYHAPTRSLHFRVQKETASFVVGYDIEEASIIYATDMTALEFPLSHENIPDTNTLLGGSDFWVWANIDADDPAPIHMINVRTGELTTVEIGPGFALGWNHSTWNGTDGCLYSIEEFDTTSGNPRLDKRCSGVSTGITSIGLILRAAMTEWTPDVSPLIEGDHFDIDAALFADPFLVTGATFTQLMSPREVAEQCMTWKPCIFFEGGDTIRFKPRDGAKVATIRHQDMGRRGRGEEVKPTVVTTRADDAQLPREARIKFLDQNRMFSANTAYARITRSRSSLVQESDLQFAGTPSEAKFAAWTAMGEAYAQRREMKASLPLKYFILEPSDVIDLPDNDGNLIECRLAQAELGANWIIDVKANDHVNSYDDVTFAAEAGVADALPLVTPKAPLTYVLDLPRLTDDAELDDGLQLVWGLGGTYEAWKGGVMYRDALSGGGETAFGEDFGDEETSFEEIGTTSLGVDAGKITTPPSGDVDEFTVDRISVMRVTFDTILPDFSSLSDGQFLTGLGNVFAIGNNVDGWEIVQAQVATKISDQVWDFSTLRRGLRGTEWAIGQAEAGYVVVRLETATLQRDAFAAGDIGQTITYRGVTFNMDVTTASDTDILVVGRGLIPYSPLLGEVYRDAAGEITGTVYARALQADDADQFFLVGADFEIDIKDAPGGTVLRTLELTDTGDFTYTAADQTTDFGDTEATVDAELFQLDDDGDRGYGREVIL